MKNKFCGVHDNYRCYVVITRYSFCWVYVLVHRCGYYHNALNWRKVDSRNVKTSAILK